MSHQPYQLTPRQRQVFELLSRGQSVKQIASEVRCSSRGVEKTMAAVRSKLNARTTCQAVALLVHHGLITFEKT